MRKAIIIVLLALVLGSLGGIWWKAHSDTLELSKTEALQLMDLQYRVVMTTSDRDEFIRALYAKYALKQSDYNLDVKTGRFTPVERKDAKK